MAKIVITIEDGDEPGSVKLGIDMPKLNLESVLMRGGRYWITQGVYSPEKLSNSPAGFYLRSGSELTYCDWVEWWFPIPNNPK